MISNQNYEAQMDEIELLKNILFEQLTVSSEFPNFVLQIKAKPDVVEDPKLDLLMKITLSADYPDVEPKLDMHDLSNLLPSYLIKESTEKMLELCADNIGMPVIYQLYEQMKVGKIYLLDFRILQTNKRIE